MNIPILLETEHLLIVDKPHAWLTTPARSMDDPRLCLGRRLQQQLDRQIFPVHRLDFEVSGLTVWAKDTKSHTLAQQWFEASLLRKVYEAHTRPGLEANFKRGENMRWTSKLVRGKKRSFEAEHGKLAITEVCLITQEKSIWRWELMAVTGRPHQLRFEMKKHDVPILGDVLYGGEPWTEEHWIALRAVSLDFSRLPEGERLGLPAVVKTTGLP